MIMNLWETGIEGAQLMELLAEAEGELTPELEARVDAFLSGGKEKLNAALHVRKRMEFEARVCREEAERLWARAKAIEKQRDGLSKRVLFVLDNGFGGKVRTAFFTAYGMNCADKIEFNMSPDADIARFGDMNPDLVRVTRELNKTVLKDLIKTGGMPPEIVVDRQPGPRILMVR